MLTIKQIRDDRAAAERKLAKKGVDAAPVIDRIFALDDRRRAIQVELDTALAAQNKAAKEIGMLMGQGRREEAEERKRFVADLKARSTALQEESKSVQEELQSVLVTLPNFPAEIVPEGRTAEDNLVVKLVESYTELLAEPLPHWELARKYDIIDFDLGVKLTGAGFPVYKGKGARLQRALINYFLDCNTRAGYLEVEPPVMVNEASGFGTGQLPDKEGQMYHATADNFYLVPTAEVPVTNIYRDVILDEQDFPVKMTAYTPCFRREAGSYGKDVRGLNRLHQFDKVEIVQLSLPETSYEALDGMVAHVESIVKSLGLPYRILRLCGGGFALLAGQGVLLRFAAETEGQVALGDGESVGLQLLNLPLLGEGDRIAVADAVAVELQSAVRQLLPAGEDQRLHADRAGRAARLELDAHSHAVLRLDPASQQAGAGRVDLDPDGRGASLPDAAPVEDLHPAARRQLVGELEFGLLGAERDRVTLLADQGQGVELRLGEGALECSDAVGPAGREEQSREKNGRDSHGG